jgi:hypothetical protein
MVYIILLNNSILKLNKYTHLAVDDLWILLGPFILNTLVIQNNIIHEVFYNTTIFLYADLFLIINHAYELLHQFLNSIIIHITFLLYSEEQIINPTEVFWQTTGVHIGKLHDSLWTGIVAHF